MDSTSQAGRTFNPGSGHSSWPTAGTERWLAESLNKLRHSSNALLLLLVLGCHSRPSWSHLIPASTSDVQPPPHATPTHETPGCSHLTHQPWPFWSLCLSCLETLPKPSLYLLTSCTAARAGEGHPSHLGQNPISPPLGCQEHRWSCPRPPRAIPSSKCSTGLPCGSLQSRWDAGAEE